MLRVASRGTLVVPPFECAWLSLPEHQLHDGAFCLQFDCQGENDVTLILKPSPGTKRWQHLQRLGDGGGDAGGAGGGGGGERLAVEANYTIILGSHRNSKLKLERNGEEVAAATGLPGCTVSRASFSPCWVSYTPGRIAVGTGAPAGPDAALSFVWTDPAGPAGVPDIQAVGLSCWDKHVSYRNVQLLPPLSEATLARLQEQLERETQARELLQQQQEQQEPADGGAHAQPAHEPSAVASKCGGQPGSTGPLPLLQLVQQAIVAQLRPATVCRVLALAELLLPRTQALYEAAVQLAGECFALLVRQRLQDLAALPLDVLVDVLHEPLLDVSELDVFRAVAAWCQAGGGDAPRARAHAADAADSVADATASREVLGLLQLVRFALLTEQERQAVLAHPFTQACPLVLRCVQADMQRLHDAASGAAAPPQAGGFQCQQRRLVLPAGAGGDAASAAQLQALGLQEGSPPAAGLEPRAPPRDGRAGGGRRGGGSWLRRRLAPSCKELMYVHDGDRNGVIHHIATEYGTKPWVNPVLSKALEVKASSPPSRHTDPKAIASSHFLNTSFAGPRYVRPAAAAGGAPGAGDQPTTWWQVDLGPRHRLLVNYYVMRHDGSHDGFARSWVLQGSNDGTSWLDLRRHACDTTIKAAGQYGSWPVSGPAAAMPFRAFRLLLTAPTQSATNPWAFCLSYLELYGWFFKLRDGGGAAALTRPLPPP